MLAGANKKIIVFWRDIMSTYFRKKEKCQCCGYEFEIDALGSTNSFGSPDLDLRPAGMQRYTMSHWITECSNCGFVYSGKITNVDDVKEYINSENYQTCENLSFRTDLAKSFYKHGLICLMSKKFLDAARAFLHAAWVCDDNGEPQLAIVCRSKSLETFEYVPIGSNNNLKLQKADILRRALRFDETIDYLSKVRFSDEFLRKILAFQIKLSKAHDSSCYTVKDAVDAFGDEAELIEVEKILRYPVRLEVGCQVTHKHYGKGTIVGAESDLIEIIFSDKQTSREPTTKKFRYPDAFVDGFLEIL